jgi:hypothetical protein
MKKINEMKRPRVATIIAALALFIAIGGSATAASGLINGKKIKKGTVTAKQIKKGTITAKQIKNKTITKGKLKPALVKSLKGKTGPQGPKGAKGDKGDPGANGVVAPIVAEFDNINLTANTELAVGTMDLPAGKYIVTATARVFSSGTANFGCSLNSGSQFSESSTWSSPVASSRTTLPIQMVTTDGTTQVTLGCHPGNANGSAGGTLIATPVQ